MYQHWGGGPMAEYYESGFVNDITEMYNTYDHPAFIEASIAQSTYEDKILAIPSTASPAAISSTTRPSLKRLA